MINGKTYRLNFSHQPSKHEIKAELERQIKEHTTKLEKKNHTTLKEAIQNYIEVKKNILSPTTIADYYYKLRTITPELLQTEIKDITTESIQKFINIYTLTHSPKSCKNIVNIITTPIKFYEPEKRFNVRTPQLIKHNVYIPTDNEIERLKKYFYQTPYESIFLLSLYGLRQSEIQALTINDLNTSTNELTINKAKVKDYQNKFVIKTTKTINSSRKIIINDYLSNLIQRQGYITTINQSAFKTQFSKALEQLNIKHFRLHDFRHRLASKLHQLNIPTKYIQEIGGWSTDNVLKNVYTHTIETEKNRINKLLNDKIF